jgi:hypothetical protein
MEKGAVMNGQIKIGKQEKRIVSQKVGMWGRRLSKSGTPLREVYALW